MGFWEKLESENEERKAVGADLPQEAPAKAKLKLKLKKPSKKTAFGVTMAVVIVSSLAAAGFFYYQYRNVKLAKNTSAQEQSEVDQLTAKISQFMELPQGETPVLATVSDKSKLGSQAFFAKAENGDKILIYNKAGQALIYRPTSGKIINVAQATLGNQNEQVSQQAVEPQEEPASGQSAQPQVAGEETISEQEGKTVALYNGTSKKGVTFAFEKYLTKEISDIAVGAKESAAKQDYVKTLVIDLKESNADLAKSIADKISAEVSPLPQGETAPNGDILIILGSDRL